MVSFVEALLRHTLKFPLTVATELSILLPLLFVRGYKGQPTYLRWVVIFIGWTTFRNLTSIVTSSYRINNLMLFNADLLVRALLLLAMFYHTFPYSYEKRAIVVVGVLFTLFFGFDFVWSNPDLSDWQNHRLNRYSYVVENVLMLTLVLRFFLYLVRELPVDNLLEYPMFWICCGLLIAHAGSVFLSPFIHYTFVWNGTFKLPVMVIIEQCVEITRNIGLAIALSHARRLTP